MAHAVPSPRVACGRVGTSPGLCVIVSSGAGGAGGRASETLQAGEPQQQSTTVGAQRQLLQWTSSECRLHGGRTALTRDGGMGSVLLRVSEPHVIVHFRPFRTADSLGSYGLHFRLVAAGAEIVGGERQTTQK